jgi:hypothetical protein
LVDGQRELAKGQELLRQQRADLLQRQAQQRHEVSAFKLFLSEWQERLTAFRDQLLQEQSAVARQAADLAAQHAALDQEVEALSQRQNQVAEQEADVTLRREVLTRHLRDLQLWYQQKMRELADRDLWIAETGPTEATGPRLALLDGDSGQDERLADCLLELELVDPSTLTELRTRAQAEQCSLARLLVEGGLLTPWQVRTILSGRIGDLLVSNYRIIDLLQSDNRESVRLAYDPDRGVVVLRTPAPTVDRSQLAAYRTGFLAAAQVRSDHVLATLAVHDFDGLPIVVQEHEAALPASQWRQFARLTAVWLRLVEQAALGLAAVHAAGLVHGHLQEDQLVLDRNGRLRIAGLGEPPWLWSAALEPVTSTAWEDLRALGRIAAGWLTSPSASRLGRSHHSPLDELLQALEQPGPVTLVSNAQQVAEYVRSLRRRAPDDELAWQRLLAFLHERLRSVTSMPGEAPPSGPRLAA